MLVRHDKREIVLTDLVGKEEASAGALRTVRRDGVDSHRGEEKLLGDGLGLHEVPYSGIAPCSDGGGSGIRTLEGVTPLLVFKTSAFNRSANPPYFVTC